MPPTPRKPPAGHSRPAGVPRRARKVAGRTSTDSPSRPQRAEAQTEPSGQKQKVIGAPLHETAEELESSSSRSEPRGRRTDFKPFRQSKVLMLLSGLTVVFAVFAVVAFFQPGVNNVDNKAWVDTDATAEVTAAARDALETVFSYKFDTIDEDQAAARAVLTDERRAEYDSTAEQTKQSVLQTTTIASSTVTDIGVTVLDDGRAELVASLDVSASQDSVDRGTVQTPAVVTMERVDGKWLIAVIDNR